MDDQAGPFSAESVIVYLADEPIIDEHADNGMGSCQTCALGDMFDPAPHPCRTLRLLAVPYSEHPGYRPEWRP